MRTLLTLLLLLPLTVQGQAIWRNFFVTNQNPRVTVVAGSNATVQASTVGVDQRIFTVNAIPGGTINTNDLNGWLSTNVAGFAVYATNAGFATNATYALWGTNSFYILTAILTNQVYGSNIVGAVPEATHATNADVASSVNGTITNAINSTNVTLTGLLQIYGTSYRTNGIYIDSSGEVLSNASGGVTIAGGNVSATGSVVATNSAGTNALLGAAYIGANYTNMAVYADTNALQFRNTRANGTNIFYVDPATGALLWNQDGTYNFGASSSGRVKNMYVSGNLNVGADVVAANIQAGAGSVLSWSSRSTMASPANGSFRFSDAFPYPVTKVYINGPVKALISASAVSLFTVTGRTNDFVGGTVDFTIFCTDNTEAQTYSGHVVYSCINTNGVWYRKNAFETGYTNAITSGTLTTAWGVIDDPTSGKGSTNVNVQVTATTSLTPAASKFYILWQLRNSGTNSITAL